VLGSAQGKTCLLLAVLEVDGPDEVTVRRGPDAGRVVSVLRLIVGDEAGTIRKLTAWRAVAEAWGGATQEAVGMRRGDVVYFESTLRLVCPSHDPCLVYAMHAPLTVMSCDRCPGGHAHGRRQRGNPDDALHHGVAKPPLARRNLLSDDAAFVRALRCAPPTRSPPRGERRRRAPCCGRRHVVREFGWPGHVTEKGQPQTPARARNGAVLD
jgi:hypothetical protein